MKNIDDRIKENDKCWKSFKKIKEKIKKEIDDINKKKEKEVNSIIKEIEIY